MLLELEQFRQLMLEFSVSVSTPSSDVGEARTGLPRAPGGELLCVSQAVFPSWYTCYMTQLWQSAAPGTGTDGTVRGSNALSHEPECWENPNHREDVAGWAGSVR